MSAAAERMLNQTVFDTEGRSYILNELIGEGTQGSVFRTEDNFIVKIGFDSEKKSEELRQHYQWLIRRKFTGVDIAKPVALLQKPFVGYVMCQVDKNYCSLSQYLINAMPEDKDFEDWYQETGGLKKRLMIGALLALNLRNLHINGLTYVDLSPENILVSKKKNSIVLIDSDNISVSAMWRPLIIGTPGFIAPEILSGEKNPDSLSDTYSFAVILFELLRLGHPFIGDKIFEASPEVEEEALKGNAAFIDNPEDDSNRNSNISDLENIFLTPDIKELFQKTFVAAMKNRMFRPTLLDFRIACLKARDLLFQCPKCGNFFYWNNEKENICPFCDEKNENVPHLKFCKKAFTKSIQTFNPKLFIEKNLSRIENYHNLILQNGVQSLKNYHLDFNDCLEPKVIAKINFDQDEFVYITPSPEMYEKIQIRHLSGDFDNHLIPLKPNETYRLTRGKSILFFEDKIKFSQEFLNEFPGTNYHIYAKVL